MKLVQLSQIANFINGYAFKPSDWGKTGSKIIRIQNLTDESKPFNRTTKKVLDKYIIRKGDILVSWSATLGVFEWTDDEDALLNQHIFKVDPDLNLVEKSYFKYVLRYSIEEMLQFTHGSTMKHIVRGDFLKHEVPLPSLEEQIKIVNLLDQADSLRQKRMQAIDLLDEYLKSVFLEMFGDPVLNPNNFPMYELKDLYIDKKNGTKCGPFGSALKKHEYVEEGIPVWNMDNISKSGKMLMPFRMWITDQKYEDLKTYSIVNGDVIISRAGTVGKMCVVKTNYEKSIISTNLIRIRFGKKILPIYFVSLMNYCKGRVGRLKTGPDGSFTHMNTGVLDKLDIPLPPIEAQKKFSHILESVESLKNMMLKQCNQIDVHFNALMQRSFTPQ